jgi:hypothetical protein
MCCISFNPNAFLIIFQVFILVYVVKLSPIQCPPIFSPPMCMSGLFKVLYTLPQVQRNPLDFYWNFPKITGKMDQKKSIRLQLHSSESPVSYKMHSAGLQCQHWTQPDWTCLPDHFHWTPMIKTLVKFQRSPLEFRWTFQNVIFKTQQIKVWQKSTGLWWTLHQKFVEIIWIALITFENNVWISSFRSILK